MNTPSNFLQFQAQNNIFNLSNPNIHLNSPMGDCGFNSPMDIDSANNKMFSFSNLVNLNQQK